MVHLNQPVSEPLQRDFLVVYHTASCHLHYCYHSMKSCGNLVLPLEVQNYLPPRLELRLLDSQKVSSKSVASVQRGQHVLRLYCRNQKHNRLCLRPCSLTIVENGRMLQ